MKPAALGLCGAALLIGAYNTLDMLADLRDYHDVWAPNVLMPILKSFVGPLVGIFGGWFLTPPGESK